MKKPLSKFLKKYYVEMTLMVGVLLTSYGYIALPCRTYTRLLLLTLPGIPKTGITCPGTPYKIIGILLVALGVIFFIRKYLLKKK